MRYGRRAFLGAILWAVGPGGTAHARQAGLDAFAMADPSCAPVDATPAVAPDETYRPGAPLRTSLVAPGAGGAPLELSGVVAGVSCGPIPGADIEFWQADAAGRYDLQGNGFRGRQRTGPRGEYRVQSILPGAAPGRAPCIHVHVVVEGRAELWTVLFFAGRPENSRDPRVRDALMLTLSPRNGAQHARFDIRLAI